MGKLFRTLLIFVIALLLLSGCKPQEKDVKITAYFLSEGSDGGELATAPSEIELWSAESKLYDESSIAKTYTVEFEGKEYTGKYDKSYFRIGTNFRADRYDFDEGYFEIDSSTDTLVCIFFFIPAKTEKTISFEQGKEIAQKIAQKYININDYEFTADEKDPFYSYTYKKMLNGIETSEIYSIMLNYDGTVKSSRIQLINTFPAPGKKQLYEERINLLTSKAAINAVNEKIAERYPQIKEKDSNTKYEINGKWCVPDENNTPCMLYRVKIEESKIIEDKEHISSALEWVVVR